MGKFLVEKNQKIICLITEDKYRMMRHIGMVVSFFILYLSAQVLFDVKLRGGYKGNYGIYHSLMPFIIFTIIIYVNLFVYMPLFFRGKYLLYILLVMGTCMVGLTFLRFVTDIFFDPYMAIPRPERINSVLEMVAATIFTTPIVLATTTGRLMQKWIKDNEQISELKNLTVNMELNALKNQINPHFLFNMLNNVNMLVKTNPSTASAIILKLSEFLRHQLYRNDDEKTSLMAETEFLSNFLNLEKIRRDNFSFSITTEAVNKSTAGILIPPNLFTTFVENAIKHSVDLSGSEAWVHIDITAQNNLLHFSCVNSMNPDEQYRDTHEGGWGWQTLKGDWIFYMAIPIA